MTTREPGPTETTGTETDQSTIDTPTTMDESTSGMTTTDGQTTTEPPVDDPVDDESTDETEAGNQRVSALTTVDSPRAKLVFLYLDAVGDATPSRLCTDLDVRKLSLLSVLRTLESHGLVERREDGRVAAVIR